MINAGGHPWPPVYPRLSLFGVLVGGANMRQALREIETCNVRSTYPDACVVLLRSMIECQPSMALEYILNRDRM